jgi:hypothetical protein
MRFPTVWGCFVDQPVLMGKLPKDRLEGEKLEKDNDQATAERHLCQLGPHRLFGYVSDQMKSIGTSEVNIGV